MASLPTGGLAAVYNPLTGVTESFDLSTLSTSGSSDARWVSNYAYSEGEIVTYNGKLWESIIPGAASNTGNTPIEGQGNWTERSKSASGLTMYVPGVFTETEVFVLNTLDVFIQLFRLVSPTRPYNSVNFALEYSNGDWVLASERGYMAVSKAAHGFVLNDVLTFKAGNWNKFTTGDKALAIVKQVVDVDRVIVYLTGNRIKGLAGLTPNSVYYAQTDATISTVVSDTPLFVAISTTEAIQLSAGGSAIQLWVGEFISLAALNIAYPTADPGNWATVDAGIGTDVVKYIWDETDGAWVAGGGAGTPISDQAQADAGTDDTTAMSPLKVSRRAQKVFTGNVSGAVSIDLDTAEVFILTLTANITSFTFTNEKVGKQYIFVFKQGNTNYTITFTAAKFAFPFGNAPVLTSGLTLTYSKDIITALCTEVGKLNIVFTPDLVNN
jgi:hypothetical protein